MNPNNVPTKYTLAYRIFELALYCILCTPTYTEEYHVLGKYGLFYYFFVLRHYACCTMSEL